MRPLIIAHRGASGYLPEHTLAAKRLAHQMGADFLEQDLVASRDDELIVLHDVHLDRVTNVATLFPHRARDDGRYYVRDFDLAELRQLQVWERMQANGRAVYPQRYPARTGDFRLNTLSEEIELVHELNSITGRNAGIYPEIKRPAWHRQEGVDIAPLLLKTLADHGYSDRADPVFIQCFDDAEIRRLREDLDCPWKLVQLLGENDWQEAGTDYDFLKTRAGLEQIAATADAIGPWVNHLYTCGDTDSVPAPTSMVTMAHELGLGVHPYTFRVDDLPAGFHSFERLITFCVAELGVDALFTDFPDKVLELLSKPED
jgi:glycerophosphoryl diester phosphodiesterase